MNTRLVYVTPEIPSELKHCKDVQPNNGKAQDQKDASQFVTKLAGGYINCKTKLSSVITINEETAARAVELQAEENAKTD